MWTDNYIIKKEKLIPHHLGNSFSFFTVKIARYSVS